MAITPSALAIKTTADVYLKDASDLTIRRRLWLALMQSRGRIIANANQWTMYWLVYYKEPSIRASGDGTESVFTPHDGYKQLSIGITAREASSALGHMANQINQGATGQIINLYGDQMIRLVNSMRHDFGNQFYKAGSGQDWSGLYAPRSYTACATTDKIATPSGSYGGLTCGLADYGGTWSTDLPAASRPNATLANDWPYGIGSSEYDFVSPKYVNTNCTNWRTATAGIGPNIEEIYSFTNQALRSLTGDDEVTNLFCASGDHFSAFKNAQAPKFRQMQPSPAALQLGFNEVYNFEGAMVNHDVHCPGSQTIVMNYDQIELFHAGPQLIQSLPPQLDIKTMAYLFKIFTYGNMRLQPKFLAYIGDFTS